MKFAKIISGLFLFMEITALFVLSSCLLIAEVWVAEKPDEYRYPSIEIMEPITVKAGEPFTLPTYNPLENEVCEFIIANPDLIFLTDDGSFYCKSCASSSIYLYIREKEIPSKEIRYKNISVFNIDISSFLNRIYYQMRDFLDIELMKERTEIRTLKIMLYPVVCDELNESKISRIDTDNIHIQDTMTVDASMDDLSFEIAEYDKSIIEAKPDESGKIIITALKEGTVSLTVDYYTEISIYE